MWSSRLFWKMFLSYAALLLLAAMTFVIIQSRRQRTIVFDQVRRRLHDSAIIVREYLGDTFPRQATAERQQRFRRLESENGTRITLVAEDGSVVGDSSKDPRRMENHGSRDEIVQARASGTGDSQRLSPTLGIPMMYFAVRLGTPQQILGYVRVAMPMENVNEQVAAVEHLIWTTAMTSGLAALVLTYFVIRPVIKPLGLLTRAAQAIERGDLTHAVAVTNRDELGTLAVAFNSMRQELALRIEQLQHSRQDLEESSKLLETVLESMVEGVVVVNQERTVLYANQAAHRLLDIPVQDVIGRPIWEIVRDTQVLEVLKAIVEHPVSQRIEFEIVRTRSVASLSASPLPGESCAGVVLVLYDVTELRRLERVRQDFVSNVSHELKTPLTSIRAYTETLLNGALDDGEHNY